MTELSPEVAKARKRPGMYIGDTGTYGLSHLVYFLLDAAVAEARAGALRRLSLSLEEDGSVELHRRRAARPSGGPGGSPHTPEADPRAGPLRAAALRDLLRLRARRALRAGVLGRGAALARERRGGSPPGAPLPRATPESPEPRAPRHADPLPPGPNPLRPRCHARPAPPAPALPRARGPDTGPAHRLPQPSPDGADPLPTRTRGSRWTC